MMQRILNLKAIAIAITVCLIMVFVKTTNATQPGIAIKYRSFSGTKTIGLPADKYMSDLARLSKQMLDRDRQINFQKISPRPEIPNDDIIAAVGSGGKLVNGSGFDAAYISGNSLNPAWGFIYNSGIPVSGVDFGRFLGFLYGNNTEKSGFDLAREILDKRQKNIVVIPLVGGTPQGSGYFPQPVSDTEREPGIGLAGLCQQPWTFRYLPPAQNVLDLACDRLVGSQKKINFVTAVPGGQILDRVSSNEVRAFEFVTPKDDFALFFTDAEKPNLGELGLKYMHYPSWHQPFLITYLIINQQVWQMLSPEQQELILTSAQANVTDSYAMNLLGQGEALQNILTINQNDDNDDNDMVLVSWSEEDLTHLRSATDEFLKLRMQDDSFSAEDRQDYQLLLSAYQNYLQGDRDYCNKFTTLADNN